MKVLNLFSCLALICLHGASANVIDSPSQHVSASGGGVIVASVHRRITSVPSRVGAPAKSLESGPVGTIDRTIQTLRRSRRDVTPEDFGTTTSYPKHHHIQPNEVPFGEFMPEEDLDSTTAPFTENHHSWKRTRVLNY